MHKTHHSEANIAKAATLFFRVRGLVRRELAQGRKLDPSAWLHIETLVYIRTHCGPSMSDIADYLAITAPSATSLIAALVSAGFVRRIADPADKRAWCLSLTAKGDRELAKTVKRGMRALGGLFAPLSAAELAAFTHALGRIQEEAGPHRIQPGPGAGK